MKKRLFFLILLSFIFITSSAKDEKMDLFISNLMKKMTLDEKIGQLNLPSDGDIITGISENSNIGQKIKNGQVGGLFNIKGVKKIKELQRIAVENSRMKIPLLFGMDVIHGYETIFPIPIALSCTWNMNSIEEVARISAKEASADGICWTFSPMVDISRDPRWGRVSEGCGEDPFLGGKIARAMVRGYQGKDNTFSSNSNILSCVKHFALYGAVEAGREYNTVDMSPFRMFNDYMYPYQAAVEEGAASVMAAFNINNGVPAHADKWLLTDILRDKWNFKGFTVADYTGIGQIIDQGICEDMQSASTLSLTAGLEMDMVSEAHLSTLKKSVEEGKISEKLIDNACRHILEAKYKLGLFKNPYKYCDETRATKEIYTTENRTLARKIAAESFVLLKNENNTLPLNKKQNIAIVGPLANTRSNMVGTWSVAANLKTPATVVEGIKSAVGGKANVLYAKGSNLTSDPVIEANATMFGRSLYRDNRTDEELMSEALSIAAQADVIVAAMGESSEYSGEASSRVNLDIPDVQKKLLKELLKTGKPVVLVLFTGRPLTLTWENENVPAILNVWFGGSESAYAIADVLFGDINPSGKLVSTFPRSVGQIPIYYNHYTTGRQASGDTFEKYVSTYIDERISPLYPFGYGLSYTEFSYGNIELNAKEMTENESITASVQVTNIGKKEGAEVVQLYIRDLVATIARPVKELKGFEKIYLKPGESKIVTFKITPDLLKFYNSNLDYQFEKGDFEIMIGKNSQDVTKTKFTLK